MTTVQDGIEVIDEATAQMFRKMSGAQKLAMLDQMWQFAVTLTRAAVRQQHPDWNEPAVARETARRLSGDSD